MDADHIPAQIGTCPLCDQAVYELAPISSESGLRAHVACVAHRRLDRQAYIDDAPVLDQYKDLYVRGVWELDYFEHAVASILRPAVGLPLEPWRP